MDKEYAQYLLQKTKDDYNRIAEDFSEKRSYLSDDIKLLGKYADYGDRILDLGCGNGRLFELFKGRDIEYIGADVSEKLIAIAKEKYFYPLPSSPSLRGRIKAGEATANFQVVDFLNLFFPDDCFDKIYCLSVFHHIPSKEFRLQFLKEARRVLKPGGLLILTVWNFWPAPISIFKNFTAIQGGSHRRVSSLILEVARGCWKLVWGQGWGIAKILKYDFLKIILSLFPHLLQLFNGRQIIVVDAGNREHKRERINFEQINFSRLDFGDIFIPFKDSQGKKLAERYYHCFTNRELEKLFEKSGFEIKETNILKRGKYENICLIGKNVI